MIMMEYTPQFKKHAAFVSLKKEFDIHHRKVTPWNL